jgi:hypothetical protein
MSLGHFQNYSWAFSKLFLGIFENDPRKMFLGRFQNDSWAFSK